MIFLEVVVALLRCVLASMQSLNFQGFFLKMLSHCSDDLGCNAIGNFMLEIFPRIEMPNCVFWIYKMTIARQFLFVFSSRSTYPTHYTNRLLKSTSPAKPQNHATHHPRQPSGSHARLTYPRPPTPKHSQTPSLL